MLFPLEASFSTYPPTVLDVAGENLPLTGSLVGASSIVFSFGDIVRLSSFMVAPCRLALVVLQSYVVWCRSTDYRISLVL